MVYDSHRKLFTSASALLYCCTGQIDLQHYWKPFTFFLYSAPRLRRFFISTSFVLVEDAPLVGLELHFLWFCHPVREVLVGEVGRDRGSSKWKNPKRLTSG